MRLSDVPHSGQQPPLCGVGVLARDQQVGQHMGVDDDHGQPCRFSVSMSARSKPSETMPMHPVDVATDVLGRLRAPGARVGAVITLDREPAREAGELLAGEALA